MHPAIKRWFRRPADDARNSQAARSDLSNGSQTDALLRTAFAHHQAGRLSEAEPIYRELATGSAPNLDALHLLGVLCHQTGRNDESIALIDRAIQSGLADANAHANLAAAYRAFGLKPEAEAALRRAVELEPNSAACCNALGVTCAERSELAEAEAWFRHAVDVDGDYTEAWVNLGNVCKDRAEFGDAEEHYRRALQLRPEAVACHVGLGAVLLTLVRLAEAEASYREATRLMPTSAEAWNGLGIALRRQGCLTDAAAAFREALHHQHDFVEARVNLADALLAGGDLERAESCIEEAIALRPDFADALNTRAVLYQKKGLYDEAEEDCRHALAIDSRNANAFSTLGTIATRRGHYDDAERSYREAIMLRPSSALFRFNLAILLLLRGDYAEGLPLFESRFEAFTAEFSGFRKLHLRLRELPRWNGESLDGKRLLVWAEQGLGDTLMMMRFLPLISTLGSGAVTVYCPPALERIIAGTRGVDRVLTNEDAVEPQEFDLHCPMMSLPLAFGVCADSIPADVPYLVPNAAEVESWSQRFAGDARPRVGLVWSGSATLRDDAQRSIRLQAFQPLLDIDGVEWVSLQKGEASAQLTELRAPIDDWMNDCVDLMDTGALVANVDLVISVDTAVAHLAGALGKPVWLLNRYGSEWRWALEGESTAWYPTMRLFRQTRHGDWAEVIERVKAALAQHCAESRRRAQV